MLQQALRDSHDLLRRFALPENHLRHAVTQCPMVVHLGETQVLEWHVAHAAQCTVYVHRALAYLFQQLSELLLVHTARITAPHEGPLARNGSGNGFANGLEKKLHSKLQDARVVCAARPQEIIVVIATGISRRIVCAETTGAA